MVSNILLSAYAWATTRMAMLREERGQDIMEYAVIAGAIALVAAFVLFSPLGGFGGTIGDAVDDFGTTIAECVAFDANCGA